MTQHLDNLVSSKVVLKYWLSPSAISVHFVHASIDVERPGLVDDRMYGKGGLYYESSYAE